MMTKMNEKKTKNTFTTKLYECCSDDKLRPLMQCVHFINGMAYASDGMVSIRQTLEYHTILEPDFLEGKSLHKNNYKAIMSFEEAVATDEGIECFNENGQRAFFEYYTPPEEMKVPNFEAMFDHIPGQNSLSFIGFEFEKVNRACKALFCPNKKFRMQFTGIDTYILIDVDEWEEQLALIMPVVPEPILSMDK
jgi:hypothetical protein